MDGLDGFSNRGKAKCDFFCLTFACDRISKHGILCCMVT